jgi:hypothetical protein
VNCADLLFNDRRCGRVPPGAVVVHRTEYSAYLIACDDSWTTSTVAPSARVTANRTT